MVLCQVDNAGGTSLAISFASTVNSTLVTKFSLAVLELEQLGELDRLQTTFLRPATICSQQSSSIEPIGFSKVSFEFIAYVHTTSVYAPQDMLDPSPSRLTLRVADSAQFVCLKSGEYSGIIRGVEMVWKLAS